MHIVPDVDGYKHSCCVGYGRTQDEARYIASGHLTTHGIDADATRSFIRWKFQPCRLSSGSGQAATPFGMYEE